MVGTGTPPLTLFSNNIGFPNGPGFRYGNFFIPRVVKNHKMSPREEKAYLPRAYGPWEERISSLGLIFGGFFNPWDEEISIPETRPIRKSYI